MQWFCRIMLQYLYVILQEPAILQQPLFVQLLKLCCLLRRFFYMGHDVFHLAIQNIAERINRVSTDIGIFPKPGQLSGADVIFIYQRILRNSFFFHSKP